MMRPLWVLTAAVSAVVAVIVPALGVAGAAASQGSVRVTAVPIVPVRHDVTLAEFRFPRSGARVLSAANVQLAIAGRLGAEYVALAARAHPEHGGARALMLVAGKLPVSGGFAMRLRSKRFLGPAAFAKVSAVFAGISRRPRPPALCDLTRGAPLAGKGLRVLAARGVPPRGFSATGALAAAYDATCRLPYPLAFAQLYSGPVGCGAGGSTQSGSFCCPPQVPCSPPPEPVPAPEPEAERGPSPVPPPRCAPCDPAPGHACPLTATAAVCVASKDERPPYPPY